MTMMCTAAWRSWPSKGPGEDWTGGGKEEGGEGEGGRGKGEGGEGKREGGYPLRPQSPAQDTCPS